MELSHRNTSGFSIIELLVVLAIITVLIGIVFPTIAFVRRSAQVSHCASNLRQIGQAFFNYRADHRGWPTATEMPAPFILAAGSTIPEALAEDLSPVSGVYHCPGDVHQVFDQCAAVPGGHGISYFYWPRTIIPSSFASLMNDFQGYATKTRSVIVGQFHPPRVGMNVLKIDGSVEYGYADGKRF